MTTGLATCEAWSLKQKSDYQNPSQRAPFSKKWLQKSEGHEVLAVINARKSIRLRLSHGEALCQRALCRVISRKSCAWPLECG